MTAHSLALKLNVIVRALQHPRPRSYDCPHLPNIRPTDHVSRDMTRAVLARRWSPTSSSDRHSWQDLLREFRSRTKYMFGRQSNHIFRLASQFLFHFWSCFPKPVSFLSCLATSCLTPQVALKVKYTMHEYDKEGLLVFLKIIIELFLIRS